MTSHQRRGSGPVRQHSLQQLPRRHHPVRRQRSAEEDRSLQICKTDPTRARCESDRANAIEKPQVRIAWGDNARLVADDERENRVEVVACQIGTGKSRPMPNNSRQLRIPGRNSASDKTCSTLLYSRQELAERLRLAWKQREANKSNIDVFLAHGTTEERSDSRLSSSSSVERSPVRLSSSAERNLEKTAETKNDKCTSERRDEIKKNGDTNEPRATMNSNIPIENLRRIENNVSSTTSSCLSDSAKNKRASFRSGTNAAFLQPVDISGREFTASPEIVCTTKVDSSQSVVALTIEPKNRRTNSAPPVRRANSVGATSRTQVSIVIDAPNIGKTDQESSIPTNCTETTNCSSRIPGLAGRPIKSAPAKRRARSGKRRANSTAGKDLDAGRAKVGSSESKNIEVVTMVSLVSDADSDSEIEDNSPRDDKLISQLRSNLPTTPIIKNTVTTCGLIHSIARRPIKSVSFQQDSIDVEEPDKRTLRIRPQSVQVGRVTGSALPTPEEAHTWRTAVTSLTIPINNTSTRQNYETQELAEISLTDREKRCLIVPIGDPRSDKKRKLLRTRSTPPPRVNEVEKQASITETRDVPLRTRIPAVIENALPVQQSASILLQTSISKLTETVVMPRNESEAELEGESVEPAFQTTKEKECWHLYRRMCDKGVCVSFDTVLRYAYTNGVQATQKGDDLANIHCNGYYNVTISRSIPAQGNAYEIVLHIQTASS